MIKRLLCLIPLAILTGCTVIGIRNYEILSYRTLLKEREFEIRAYDNYLTASVESEGSYEDSSDSSFNLLFKYISGDNVSREKIEKTAPIIKRKKLKEKIEMTAPVFQKKEGNRWTMFFVLPSKYNLENVPVPSDPRVVIKLIKSQKAAVVQYSGIMNDEKIKINSLKLLKWVNRKKYRMIGVPYSAGYDPPWTIPFLRRNEILVQIR